jgi:DNA polymerase III subunit beta
MRVTFSRQQLQQSLKIASAVVSSRKDKPLLQFAKIVPAENVLIATNTEQTVEVALMADGKHREPFLVPVERLLKIVSEHSCESIEIDHHGENLDITLGRSEFRLQTASVDDFPMTTTGKAQPNAVVPAGTLREYLGYCIKAVDRQSTRYALGGVFFNMAAGALHLVATDSRRLVLCKPTSSSRAAGTLGVIPLEALQVVLSSAYEHDVEIAADGNTATFTMGDYLTLTTQLVSGRFPDYNRVIPESDNKLTVKPDELIPALRQVQIMTSEESRGVDLGQSGGVLQLAAKSSDVGTAKAEVAVASSVGDPINIRVDAKYMLEACQPFRGLESLSINYSDGDNPITFSSAEQPDVLVVLMPLSR